jgi:hypothetical protein
LKPNHLGWNDLGVPRILAVDWSGARSGERRAIWLAEAREGRLVRLECGRSREDVVEHLLVEAARDPDLVVGLDFAFSFPERFLKTRSIRTAFNAWDLVAREAETWLADPQPPFWRTRRPPGAVGFRRTELECGGQPKSVFQLVGAGQVGTGSLRGMPFLARLRERFAIWPFDEPRLPLVVEIYPRLYRSLGDEYANEHARDAAVSALAMSRWSGEWRRLPREPTYALEGRIWHDGVVLEGG